MQGKLKMEERSGQKVGRGNTVSLDSEAESLIKGRGGMGRGTG